MHEELAGAPFPGDSSPRLQHEETQLPYFPVELIDAASSELLFGELDLSNHLWSIQLDYQKRLHSAAAKRLAREALDRLETEHEEQGSEVSARTAAGLLCLTQLLAESLQTLSQTWTLLSRLYAHVGDPDNAQQYLDRVASISLLLESSPATPPSDVDGGAVNDVNLGAVSCGVDQTYSKYKIFPNGILFSEFSTTEEVGAATARPTASLVRTLVFNRESEIDLPAHRLEFITRIVTELYRGDCDFALQLWSELTEYCQRLASYCLKPLDGHFIDHFRDEGQLSDAKSRVAEVFNRIDSIGKLYAVTLRRVYLQVVRAHISANRMELARELVGELFLLHQLTDPLYTDRSNTRNLVHELLESVESTGEGEFTADKTERVAEFVRLLQKLDDASAWSHRLEAILEQSPFNANACRAFCEEVSSSFSSAPAIIQKKKKHHLLKVFRRIQQTRSTLIQTTEAGAIWELTWGLFYINRALRRRLSYEHPEEQFHDAYDFHNTVRTHPQLLSDPEIFQDLRLSIMNARSIAVELTEDEAFNLKLERQPRLRSYFYSSLGEICRAHAQYRFVSGEELSDALLQGVNAFNYCINSTDVIQAHLIFIYPRIAECLRGLNRHTEAIEFYKKLLDLNAGGPARWEAFKFIADSQLAIARDIRSKGQELALDLYYSEAESWVLRAGKVWEPEADISRNKCTDVRNSTLHYHLATIYLVWGNPEQAEQHARWALAWSDSHFYGPGYKNYRDLVTYLLGASLSKQDRVDEAIEILEPLVDTGVAKEHRSKSLLLLKSLYAKNGDAKNVGATTRRLLENVREVDDENLLPLSDAQQGLFESAIEMMAYVKQCQTALRRGHVRDLVQELPMLVAISESMWSSRQPDPVLLDLLARAYIKIAHYDSALKHIKRAFRADSSTKNQGICWLRMGELFKSQGKFEKAAGAFEQSYTQGGDNLGALLMAANAHRRARNYSKSLQALAAIMSSGRDRTPVKTASEIARTLWARYSDSTPGVGGNDDDVVTACRYLSKILLGEFGNVGDRIAASQLASMSLHADAKAITIQLLGNGPFTVQLTLVKSLTALHQYDEEFAFGAIYLIPRDNDVGNPSRRLPAYRIVAKYIIGAWIFAYLNMKREEFVSYVRKVVYLLLKRTREKRFWSDLLAHCPGVMAASVRQQMFDELSTILLDRAGNKPEKLIDYLRDVALPGINTHLETQLLGLTSPAYAGREPKCSITDELMSLLGFWVIKNNINHRVDTDLSVDNTEQRYYVTDFQREIVVSLLNQIVEQLPDVLESQNDLKSIALRLEASSDAILIKLRVALGATQTQPKYEAFCRKLVAMPALQSWKSSTAHLLPAPISVKIRPARRDVLVILPLWRSYALERPEWAWNQFYTFVVEKNYGILKSRDYYETAQDYLRQRLPLRGEELSNYVLKQFDGTFAQIHKSSRDSLASVPHTIKNILRHLTDVHTGDPKDLDALALEIRRLNKTILDVGAVVKREFDLRSALTELIDECKIFYPDVLFECDDVQTEQIVRGARGHIISAIWDVIHNSVDAVRRSPPEDLRHIRFLLLAPIDGVEVIIANTGPVGSDFSARGFGIGSLNVERVICDLHRGKLDHGYPVYCPDPFRYEWRLFIPSNVAYEREGEL